MWSRKPVDIRKGKAPLKGPDTFIGQKGKDRGKLVKYRPIHGPCNICGRGASEAYYNRVEQKAEDRWQVEQGLLAMEYDAEDTTELYSSAEFSVGVVVKVVGDTACCRLVA